MFYVYVPFDNQDDLPVFDTSVFTGTFEQLFRTNVFTGPDRVQNANQLTLALTTRLLAPGTGDEILRASIGQIRYFADRKVTLPGGTPQTSSGSEIAASLLANLSDVWRISGSWLYDPNTSQINRNVISLRYQPSSQRVVNLSYRFIRDTLNQTDLSGAWPITHNWSLVGRWAQAWDTESLVEVFGGVEYESCCWASRFVVRRFVTNTRGDFDTGVFSSARAQRAGRCWSTHRRFSKAEHPRLPKRVLACARRSIASNAADRYDPALLVAMWLEWGRVHAFCRPVGPALV